MGVKAASIIKVRFDWTAIIDLGAQLERNKIRFVNLGREVGLALQGLCEHEQMRLSFYEHIKHELPPSLTFSAVQKCIHLAQHLPSPVSTLEEANRVEAQLMLAGGFLELPKRTEQQVSHAVTPIVFMFSVIADAKDKLFRRMEEVEQWDDVTRANVRQQIERFEAALAELKAKL
jgi:hypothetical protein